MRVSLATIGVLFVTTTAYAQGPCAAQIPAYDPYKPSDLAIMREYGGTVLAQAPLSTLLKLDPYVPSQGELLRQLGRGIPVWTANTWYGHAPATSPIDCAPAPQPASAAAASTAPLTRFSDVLAELQRSGAPMAPAPPPSGSAQTERNAGVWIRFADRMWVSAGAAVPFSTADFTYVGENAGFSVYRRAGTTDDLIYVPTARGMVAPFKSAP